MAVEPTKYGFLISEHFRIAMGDAGICMTLKHLPAPKTIMALREGKIDGDIGRVSTYDQMVGAHIIRAKEPIFSADGILVSFNPEIKSVADLDDLPLGIRKDFRWQVESSVGVKNIVPVNTEKELITLLKHGRVAGILTNSVSVQAYKDLIKPEHQHFVVHRHLYAWLHKSKTAMVEKVNQAILAYKASGRNFLQPIKPQS